MSDNLLDTNVLILNRFFMAVRVIDVRRAFTLLYRQCAEVIEMEEGSLFQSYDFESWCELSELTSLEKQPGEEYLKTARFELRIPRILRLTRFEKMPMQTVRFNRKNLFARDDHTCQYCGQQTPLGQLSMDHVIPRSHGGTTSWDNIVCCCLRCNGRKGGRTPKEARMKLLRRPEKPRVNPLMVESIDDPRYASWKTFLQAK
jgi:5-methylcytosine-specific restriction endonuclease McrA